MTEDRVPPADPLVEAWRRWSDRFARNEGGDTPIRDAFAAGWDAASAQPAPPLDVERLREAHRLAAVADGDYIENVARVYERLARDD